MSADGLRTRHATADDVALLAEMGGRTFLAAYAHENDPADMDQYVRESFSVERIAAEVADPAVTFLLAYDDDWSPDAPVAYARLRAGAPAETPVGATPIELARIYVEPDTTGRGYGAALLAACLREAAARSHDVMWLGVWEHNEGAQRFYERFGFLRIGEHTFTLGGQVQTDYLLSRPTAPDAAPRATPKADGTETAAS